MIPNRRCIAYGRSDAKHGRIGSPGTRRAIVDAALRSGGSSFPHLRPATAVERVRGVRTRTLPRSPKLVLRSGAVLVLDVSYPELTALFCVLGRANNDSISLVGWRTMLPHVTRPVATSMSAKTYLLQRFSPQLILAVNWPSFVHTGSSSNMAVSASGVADSTDRRNALGKTFCRRLEAKRFSRAFVQPTSDGVELALTNIR